jgi:hypothetical protein
VRKGVTPFPQTLKEMRPVESPSRRQTEVPHDGGASQG